MAAPLVAGLLPTRSAHRGTLKAGAHELAEIWRLLGALEHLDLPVKMALGDRALDQIERSGSRALSGALIWAVARLGARELAYGPLNEVVPTEMAEAWLDRLIELDAGEKMVQFAAMQLARRTGDRYRDISTRMRGRVLESLDRHQAPLHFQQLVSEERALEREDRDLVFGERLPSGLRLTA